MNRLLRSCTAAALLAALAGPAPAADVPPRLPSDDLLANPVRAAHRFDSFVYTAAERRQEAAEKVTRLRKALADRKLDGVVIATERNLNWLTAGGKDNVVWAQRETPVRLLVTADRLYLIADNIEGPRMMTEELGGLGYEWVKYEWYEKEAEALAPLLRRGRIAFDHGRSTIRSPRGS
jgi:hypothetical protein